MKTYKSSDLTHKRAEVLKEAKINGVIIQECNTNGEVRQEYLLINIDEYESNEPKLVSTEHHNEILKYAQDLMNDKECKSTKARKNGVTYET